MRISSLYLICGHQSLESFHFSMPTQMDELVVAVVKRDVSNQDGEWHIIDWG